MSSSIEPASLAIWLKVGAVPVLGLLAKEAFPSCRLTVSLVAVGTDLDVGFDLPSLPIVIVCIILLLVLSDWVSTQNRYPSPEKVVAFNGPNVVSVTRPRRGLTHALMRLCV